MLEYVPIVREPRAGPQRRLSGGEHGRHPARLPRPLIMGRVSVVQVMTRLVCGTTVCEVLFACMSVLTFVELCIRSVKLY